SQQALYRVEGAIWHDYTGLAVVVARCKSNRKLQTSWKTHFHFEATISRDSSDLKSLAVRIRRQFN
ncbi:hypothetical protein ALC60_10841, partial [Trachymyrmex zeteki]